MPFNTVNWALRANVYEVNLRQYTKEGTLASFAAHLPRLADMGVTVLWFMPITPIGSKGRLGSLGSYYACSSYTEINPEFGSLKDFIDVVQAAHALGMKVIIDWVANHTGQDHVWTISSPDFYMQDAHGNFTERNGWSDVIDLNYNNPRMRTAMIDAMRYWIDAAGIDGFRCDMAHLVPLNFWIEARQALDAIKPLYWLAECEDARYFEAFDTTYAWAFMHATASINRHEPNLNPVLDQLDIYKSEGANTHKLFFTSNHDENSWNGTEYEKYGVTAGLYLRPLGVDYPLYIVVKKSLTISAYYFLIKMNWYGHCKVHNQYCILFIRRFLNFEHIMTLSYLVNHKCSKHHTLIVL
jgi:glycosidase